MGGTSLECMGMSWDNTIIVPEYAVGVWMIGIRCHGRQVEDIICAFLRNPKTVFIITLQFRSRYRIVPALA